MPLTSSFCSFRKSLHDTLSSVVSLDSYNTAIEEIINATLINEEVGTPTAPIIVPIVFHIVSSVTGTDIPNSGIDFLLTTLNRFFESSPIRFVLTIKDNEDNTLLVPGINRIDGNYISQYRQNTAGEMLQYFYKTDGIAVNDIGDDKVFCPGVLKESLFDQHSWDSYKVLNIFLVESLRNTSLLSEQTCVMHSSNPVVHEVNGTANMYGIIIPIYSLGDPSDIGYDYSGLSSIDNASSYTNSQGRNLVHAMGHSLGLLEVFHTGLSSGDDPSYVAACSDGCGYDSIGSSGDCCSDTNIESPSQASEDAHGITNTCEDKPLNTNNVMRFSLNSVDETVSDSFTSEQLNRMAANFYTIIGGTSGILHSIITHYAGVLEASEESEEASCSNIIAGPQFSLINIPEGSRQGDSDIFKNRAKKVNSILHSINKLYNKFR